MPIAHAVETNMEISVFEILRLLEIEMSQLAEDFKQNHVDLGMKATGDWLDSVEVVTENTSVAIYANDYTEFLANGRGPGGMPPISNLERWVTAKIGASGREATSIAWAVAKKIEREGTNYYPEGTDLIEKTFTDDVLQNVVDALGEKISIFYTQFVRNEFQNAFA